MKICITITADLATFHEGRIRGVAVVGEVMDDLAHDIERIMADADYIGGTVRLVNVEAEAVPFDEDGSIT